MESISWEEAEWTREALGLSVADFAALIGLPAAAVHAGRMRPACCLPDGAALLLHLAVNRARKDPLGRWAWRAC